MTNTVAVKDHPLPATQRERLLARLDTPCVWDLVVVGGGATGLGVALDASLRGFSVLVVESHDLASGTSSRSTKLLHGGVRYLAQGHVHLVREALAERAAVLAMAPHLAQPLPFVMPAYRWWEMPFYGAGLKLYEWMAGAASLGPTHWLGPQTTAAALPGIERQGLWGGVRYWDAQFDDARLALEVARTAESQGALILNYMEALAVAPPTAGVRQVSLRDRITGRERQVTARCVVNATGVWVDTFLRQERASDQGVNTPSEGLVSPSQGVHVVVDKTLFPSSHALLVPHTRDGRVLFAVPWLGSVVLGTTDTPRNDTPREPTPFQEELDFILTEASKALGRCITRADVRSQWVGLRPLVRPGNAGASETAGLSREHTIVVSDHGLVTVTGGKWTTFKAMANEVLDVCVAQGLMAVRPRPPARAFRLISSPVGAEPRMATEPASLHAYGTQAEAMTQRHGRVLGHGLTEAMVRHAARHEYAVTVEDVLARRCRLLFVNARAAQDLGSDVAELLEHETGLPAQAEAFEKLARAYGGG